ncbi:MAG: SDR family oxidoreductase [Acidobacteria bacterium]|nr:SDR family oxidoreductase [Acidobacteriota bacterium]
MKLEGKRVLITGAGRGIGKAVALAMAREGADLSLMARTEEEVLQTRKEVEALNRRCMVRVGDVSQEEDVTRWVEEAVAAFPRLDALINNAGVMTRPRPVHEFEVRKWDYTLNVNLRGPFLCMRMVLPHMIRQRGGSIINVTSMIARGAYAEYAAYAASKAGLEALTRTVASEVTDYGIRVNAVNPGVVSTKMTHYSGTDPKNVTGVFLFLVSDESKNTTGQVLSGREK